MSRLIGPVALVTGASSGIGEATARALAAQGATVIVAARRLERLERLAEDVGGVAVAVDVTDREQAFAAVGRAVEEQGRLDIVVNAAGVMLNGPIVGAPIDEWERMVDINVKGTLYIVHAAPPYLLEAAHSRRATSPTWSTSARSQGASRTAVPASTTPPSSASTSSASRCARR